MVEAIILLFLMFTIDKGNNQNFSLVDDFNRSFKVFKTDTLKIQNPAFSDGQMIVFHAINKDYLVFRIKTHLKSQEIHATYWTDRDVNIKIMERTEYYINKENVFEPQITELTVYYSYIEGKVEKYSRDRKQISGSFHREGQEKVKDFFKMMTDGLNLSK